MKTFTKAIFFMLATSASAWKNSLTLSESSEPQVSTAVLGEVEVSDTKKDNCPMDVKTCSNGRTVNRDPKKDCKFPKCNSRKSSTKSSKNSSSTRSSSKSSKSSTSSSRDGRKCVDDDRPRPTHSSEGRFRFKLVKSNARCVDKNRNLYEYGQFDKVKEFSDCAEACVNDVRRELLDNFRGYDWDCSNRKCRCLYDKGTLDSRNSGRFDRTNRNESGRGSVEGTEKKSDYYCAKLAGAELFGDGMDYSEGYEPKENFQAQARRAIRGFNN